MTPNARQDLCSVGSQGSYNPLKPLVSGGSNTVRVNLGFFCSLQLFG